MNDMGVCVLMLSGVLVEGGEVLWLVDIFVCLGVEWRMVNDVLWLFWCVDKDGSGMFGLKEFAETFALCTRNVFLLCMMLFFDVGGDGDIGVLEFVMCMV